MYLHNNRIHLNNFFISSAVRFSPALENSTSSFGVNTNLEGSNITTEETNPQKPKANGRYYI